MKYFTTFLSYYSIQLIICILFSSLMLSQEQGKIRRFDDEVKTEKKDTTYSKRASSPPSSASSDDISNTDAFVTIKVVGFLAEAIGYVLVGTLIQFPGEDSSLHNNTFWTRGFTDYPYFDPEQGMFSIYSKKSFAFSFSGHRLSNGNSLTGYSGRLFVSPHQSLNLEAQVVDLSEKLKTKTDHLRLYNFFIDYNRVKSERFSLWWGLGIKGMNATSVNETGLAMNSGFEFFPYAPMSVMMNYNVGFINTKSLREFFIAGNSYIDRYNFSFGYQRFAVGSAVLDGIIIGITAHF